MKVEIYQNFLKKFKYLLNIILKSLYTKLTTYKKKKKW